ncbi:MAG: hypothetical protein H6828_12080 [Planctomycetes bacterium]|nr:hypothetical protein [Planctomycetota bacterium]
MLRRRLRPRAAQLLFLPLALCGLLLAACASTSSSASSAKGSYDPVRVTFVDYRTHVRMTLVNEAHTDPVEFYSEKRTTAGTKITSNPDMQAMLREFEAGGYQQYATPGYAPATGGSAVQSLEVETPRGTTFLVTDGSRAPACDAFRKCRVVFLQMQGAVMQAQVIENDDGTRVFKKPEPLKHKK